MPKRVLITALIAALLLVFGPNATAIAKKTNLLDIKSPAKKQTCLQDTVEIVVELKDGADPSTFQAWLNSKNITHLFQPNGTTLSAVVGPVIRNSSIRLPAPASSPINWIPCDR